MDYFNTIVLKSLAYLANYCYYKTMGTKTRKSETSKLLNKIAAEHNMSVHQVRADIELVIQAAYNSDNTLIRTITKDGKMPTIEELLDFSAKYLDS